MKTRTYANSIKRCLLVLGMLLSILLTGCTQRHDCNYVDTERKTETIKKTELASVACGGIPQAYLIRYMISEEPTLGGIKTRTYYLAYDKSFKEIKIHESKDISIEYIPEGETPYLEEYRVINGYCSECGHYSYQYGEHYKFYIPKDSVAVMVG